MNLHLRPECASDQGAIAAIVAAAFRGVAYSQGNEARIVDALRAAGALKLSWVAVDRGALLGHVALSPVTVNGVDRGWLGLGPVAVQPLYQGQGVGSALVYAALAQARAEGAQGCVVLGDPGYYRRFGFVVHPGLVLEGVPPAYFQAQAWCASPPEGTVQYHPAFQVA